MKEPIERDVTHAPGKSRRSFLGDAALLAATFSLGCSAVGDRTTAFTAPSLDLSASEREGEDVSRDEDSDERAMPAPERSGIGRRLTIVM